MATGESLTGSQRVRNLQTVLHAKAKEEPERRFHALYDKVWRKDFLMEAWAAAAVTVASRGRRGEFPGHRSAGRGAVARELSRALRTEYVHNRYVGADSEETAGPVRVGDTDDPGPGGANIGHARAGADL